MKILVVCDQGNNRSVTIAHKLKYWSNDVIPVGVMTNSKETLEMLLDWAERVIVVDAEVLRLLHDKCDISNEYKIDAWNLGPDVWPRPFNRHLLAKVEARLESLRSEYCHKL